MTGMQVIFLIASVVLLFAALNVVTRKNLVHSALFLVLAFLGVAVLFVLLNAGFWAVMQVLVYIGAIAILMIFAVMLTPDVTQDEDGNPFNKNVLNGIFITIFTFALLMVLLGSWSSFGPDTLAPTMGTDDTVVQLGVAFFSADQFLIPAIVSSILLLGGFIAAMVVARPPEEQE